MATVKALVVGGGAWWSNGWNYWGWGGAGQFNYNPALSITPWAYSVTVGSWGAWNANGNSSVFSSITSIWGSITSNVVTWGTSWNGFAWWTWDNSTFFGWGGWGGSSAVWWNVSSWRWWTGWAGTSNSISWVSVTYAWGWGGASITSSGIWTAWWWNGWVWWNGSPATANTGSGWGGGVNSTGGTGWSGIVILSYATNGSDWISPSSTGWTITTSGGQTIHTFLTSWTFTMVASSVTTNSALLAFM